MAFQWWTTIAVALVAAPGLLPRRSAHFWGSPAPYERVRFPSSGLRLASRRTSRPSRHTSQRPPPRRSARAAARGRPQPADTRRHSALLMADAGGAGISPDDKKYQSCFDLMKSDAIEVKRGAAPGERACPKCWAAWERKALTCGTCTIQDRSLIPVVAPTRASRRGQPPEFAYKPPPPKADVEAARRARSPPPPPPERRNCSKCQKSCRKDQMKEHWDSPENERTCKTCKNRLERALVEETVRLDEETYPVIIISGDFDYYPSIEVPNDPDKRQCKVVVDVKLPVGIKEGVEVKQPDKSKLKTNENGTYKRPLGRTPLHHQWDSKRGEWTQINDKQERARAEVSRKINKNGSCYGKVVNAEDGKQLGSHGIRLFVKELRLRRDVNDLCVEKQQVLEALKTARAGLAPMVFEHDSFRRGGQGELYLVQRRKRISARNDGAAKYIQ